VTPTPCIAGIAYSLADARRSVRELAAAGQLTSDAGLLEEFGFDQARVATGETAYELAFDAAGKVLAKCAVDPAEIDLLIYGGLPGTLAFSPNGQADLHAAFGTTARFHYPAARLQHELGLERASLFALDQLACTTLFSAIRIARSLCLTEGLQRVLCVCADFYPFGAGREAIYNCTSDAACAVLVSRDGERNRLRAATHVSKGYYWNCGAMRSEIVASYFPTSKHTIERTLAAAGWTIDELDWVLPHNVSLRSWTLLAGMLELPLSRVWSRNIAAVGHTLAGDNFINLDDAVAAGDVVAGQKLLLFSYGFGAHWTALAIEA
jgi:3-oxoacyl-[acyl-carrier-protein] synthase-3